MGQLDKFSRETVATSPAGGWQVGHLCVAPYLSGDEETWNRCVLKSIMDVNAEVQVASVHATFSLKNGKVSFDAVFLSFPVAHAIFVVLLCLLSTTN